MGCGASKLDPNQEGRLRPVLRRRVEEFMARRNAGLSKKQLLQGDAIVAHDSEVEEDEDNNKNKEVNKTQDCDFVFHNTQNSPPIPQIIPPTKDNVEEVQNDSKNVVVDVSNNNVNVEDNSNNNNNVDGDKCGNKKEDDENKCENEKEVDENKYENKKEGDENKVEEEKVLHDVVEVSKESLHEEEEECCLDDGERLEELSLGSPSFRYLCVNNHSLDEELEDIAEHLHTEDCLKDDKDCTRQESSSSNEVSDEKQMLKKHKRRRFKRIGIPKGGKKVLNSMHSFYQFPCSCNSHNNTQLMQQETPV